MLFNFQLKPLDQITPWGGPDHPLHDWFALTEGEFWIEAGECTLLEYSEQARPAGARHCSHPVAQLHEDLMDMLPYILEPLPAGLVPYLFGNEANAWWESYETWYEHNLEQLETDAELQRIDHDAHRLMYGRVLDTGYLADDTYITLWSDDENVYFGWDNRNATEDGHAVWSSGFGEFQMSRREFISELHAFHSRLIEEMAARIEQVQSGALPPEVKVDIDELRIEQDRRADEMQDALNLESQTDWAAVERALNEVRESKQAA